MIYNKIYEFCKVKNKGTCYENGDMITPRVNYIIELLESLGLKYELDVFKEGDSVDISYELDENRKVISKDKKVEDNVSSDIEDIEVKLKEVKKRNNELRDKLLSITERDPESIEKRKKLYSEISKLGNEEYQLYKQVRRNKGNVSFFGPRGNNYFFNIILKGNSDKMVVAHHDIVNPNSDNANDNSCSVINAIATKILKPDLNVCLLDGEEMGGKGSNRVSKMINSGKFGSIKWVLNYELTGSGGKNFFIGDYPGPLFDLIKEKFDPPVVNTPFNDSVIFRQNGIDSCVINPLPPIKEQKDKPRNRRSYSVVTKEGLVLDSSLLYNCHSMEDSLSTISTKDMKEFVEKVVLEILK
jgi:hypothetical protein